MRSKKNYERALSELRKKLWMRFGAYIPITEVKTEGDCRCGACGSVQCAGLAADCWHFKGYELQWERVVCGRCAEQGIWIMVKEADQLQLL